MTGRCTGRRRPTTLAAVHALFVIACASNAAAQTSLQVPLQFDFINPGAKSLAMGGAFSGLADDATATFANPAGLTQLGASEVSFELRRFRANSPYLRSGRVAGTPTNFGIDTVAGPVFDEAESTDTGPGFAAGVYVHPSRRWVASGFRHELIRVAQSYATEGVFVKLPEEFTSRRELPQLGNRAISVTGYGASGAFKIRPSISVGGALTAFRFKMDSVFRRFDFPGFNPATYAFEVARSSQSGRDTSLGGTIGIVVGQDIPDTNVPLFKRTRVGLVYRRGPSFTYRSQSSQLPPETQHFRVPHTLSAGASVRVRPPLLVAVEVARISYSRLRLDYVVDQARGSEQPDAFRIDDGTEVHVGLQYAMPRRRGAPRLRTGLWFDPDHSLRFSPSTPSTSRDARASDLVVSTALSRGDDQIHATGGIGLTLHRRLELNVGADVTSSQFRWSTSVIVR